MVKIVDELSKNLAGGMTRRRALATFAAGLAGAFAFWDRGGAAHAQFYTGDPCQNFCADLYGPGTPLYNGCIERCLPLTNYKVNSVTVGACPPGYAPVLLTGKPHSFLLNAYQINPFPYDSSRSFEVCAPLGFFVSGFDVQAGSK